MAEVIGNAYGHPHRSYRNMPMATQKLWENAYGCTEVIGKYLWQHRSYGKMPMATLKL